MKNRTVVYTAISKGYDKIKEPKVVSPDCDYICFSDVAGMTSKIWEILPFPESNLDDVRKCRQIKVLPHNYFGEYEYSVWVDGNIEIIGDINELVEKYLILSNSNLVTFKHPLRDCLYDEAAVCIRQKKDNPQIIQNQIEKYKKENYPEKAGLVESNVLLRRHRSENVIRFMEDWWSEIANFSRRDQISFNYAAWKNDFNYDEFDDSTIREKYFEWNRHSFKVKKIVKYCWNRINIIRYGNK